MANREKRMVKVVGDGTPFRSEKVGRNEPCHCGSGKKAKHCCGADTKYYTLKKK